MQNIELNSGLSIRFDQNDMTILRGEMYHNEPMHKHTSWRAGGAVEQYYIPADLPDLVVFLQDLLEGEQVYLLGLGSNLLVRDGGLRGTVIAVHARLCELILSEQNESSGLIYAGAGVACAKVARFAARNGLAGAEFLAGIPGTVGGAMAMNAGCYGTETWKVIARAKVINRNGEIKLREPGDYQIDYRHTALRSDLSVEAGEEWFVGGYFSFTNGDETTSQQKIKELLKKRVSSQPLNFPNAGSVFRNPQGDYAARLIDLCKLKGFCIGGAMVSTKHANFIVNTGHAHAADIEALIMTIQDTVKQKTGVELIPEVKIIGEVGVMHSD